MTTDTFEEVRHRAAYAIADTTHEEGLLVREEISRAAPCHPPAIVLGRIPVRPQISGAGE